MDTLQYYGNEAQHWFNHNVSTENVVVVCVAVFLLLFAIHMNYRGRRLHVIAPLDQGEIDMLRRERDRQVELIAGDCITDALEEAFLCGKLTRAEVKKLYWRLGHVLSLRDLLPAGMITLKERLRLKAEIRQRLAAYKMQEGMKPFECEKKQEAPPKAKQRLAM